MNFVIVSTCFLPAKDAESFCTTRFASALARMGHSVHVVTLDHSAEVSEAIVKALVSDRLQITRIPYGVSRRPFLSQLRYRTDEWMSAVLDEFISRTKDILAHTENPILISRTYSISSLIVGWNCRKQAMKWICHLSDPIPFPDRMPTLSLCLRSISHYLRLKWNSRWVRRGLRDSDALSVTCPLVLDFFREQYGAALVDRTPNFVTTHIGDSRLQMTGGQPFRRTFPGKMILCTGASYACRNFNAVIAAVVNLNRQGLTCSFVHIGEASKVTCPGLADYPNAYVSYPDEPGLALAAAREADVLYTAENDPVFDYAPQLPSKFVYQLYEDKPIVADTLARSMMHDCCVQYPEAGIYWADKRDPTTLESAIREALACSPEKMSRSRIRQAFSETEIAGRFVKNVQSILS